MFSTRDGDDAATKGAKALDFAVPAPLFSPATGSCN